MDGFLVDAAQANGFSCFGIINEHEWIFYPTSQRYGRNEAGREKMLAWLSLEQRIKTYDASDWFDAWYGD